MNAATIIRIAKAVRTGQINPAQLLNGGKYEDETIQARPMIWRGLVIGYIISLIEDTTATDIISVNHIKKEMRIKSTLNF